jgi:hypothetical protein
VRPDDTLHKRTIAVAPDDMRVLEIMAALGYSKAWLTHGIVDAEFLQLQHREFRTSTDQNPEHYRHAAFVRFLRQHPPQTQPQIDALLELQDEGSDGVDLRVSRAIAVFETLNEHQLDAVRTMHPELLHGPALRKFEQCHLIARVKTLGVPAVFDEVTTIGDSAVEAAVLTDPSLRVEHVRWLSEHGATRRVRNQAKELLRSRRFRG